MRWSRNILLGNDIVNLSTERSKLKHLDQRFINRVFTDNEQSIIQQVNSDNKSTILWAIWAAKEAAFKACQKQDPGLIFSHRKFDINFDIKLPMLDLTNYSEHNINFTGTANYKNKILALTWQFSKHTVHCIAMLLDNNLLFIDWHKINYNIFIIDSTNHNIESLQTRSFAKQFLISKGFDPPIEIIRQNIIVNKTKRYGPPIVFIKNHTLTNIEISLSHDHGWGAVAFIDLMT